MDQEASYHLEKIPKGKLGESSKILEEIFELIDAEKQGSKIMAIVECSDIYGALELYVQSRGFEMDDLKKMSEITKRVFKNGHRKSSSPTD